jgi:hypothetical protein
LPVGISVSNFPTVNTVNSTNGICFGGRGEVYKGAQNFTVTDDQQMNNAVTAVVSVSTVGDISYVAKDRNGNVIPKTTTMPGSDLN